MTLISIGGRTIGVGGESGIRFARHFDGFRPFVIAEGSPRCSVRFDEDVKPFDDGDLLSRFVFAETGADCLFCRKGDVYQFVMRRGDGQGLLVAMQYRRGGDVVLSTACDNFSAMRFATWFACSMLTASSGLTFVHSSVIVFRGRAVLFLGESGTGKSTHTRLWLRHIPGSRLLNDDSPMLSVVDGDGSAMSPVAFGSPWSGKTPCYQNRQFPLAAVVRLSQAPHNVMHRLNAAAAFSALQPSLPPALMQDDWFTDALVDIISATVGVVPFFHLECLPDADAARLSCGTIFSER